MSRILWFLAVSVSALIAQQATLLDRIAVTVGKDVITEGDIVDEVRMTAFLNGDHPDFGADSRRKAAERLVDQSLVRREMRISQFPEPETSESVRLLAQLKRDRFSNNDAAYQKALREYGITEQELKTRLLWQLAALRFTSFRFRPGQPQTTQSVSQHLETHSGQRAAAEARRPEPRTDTATEAPPRNATARPKPPPAQNAVPPTDDQQLDAWLQQARSRARIEFRKEAFQ